MADLVSTNNRDTVIRAIENCIDKPKCRDCPWETCECDHEHVEMPLDLVQQALEILKKQEPIFVRYTTSTIRCPKCNKQITSRGAIHNEIKYCWTCGQAVKWK